MSATLRPRAACALRGCTRGGHLAQDPRIPSDIVGELQRLPGFRNVLIHEYVELDMQRVVEALERLEPVERFLEALRVIESS